MSQAISSKDFDEKVLKADGTVLVDFWATWCPPCHALAPIMEQISEEMKDKATVYKLDVDANQGLAMQYGIRSIPTVMVFKDGKPVETMIGVQPKMMYSRTIEHYA